MLYAKERLQYRAAYIAALLEERNLAQAEAASLHEYVDLATEVIKGLLAIAPGVDLEDILGPVKWKRMAELKIKLFTETIGETSAHQQNCGIVPCTCGATGKLNEQ